jgi:transcriptional regulator with XRE-family HTH domain
MNLKLKFKRIEKGLTQFQLAELIGATNQTISEYER